MTRLIKLTGHRCRLALVIYLSYRSAAAPMRVPLLLCVLLAASGLWAAADDAQAVPVNAGVKRVRFDVVLSPKGADGAPAVEGSFLVEACAFPAPAH